MTDLQIALLRSIAARPKTGGYSRADVPGHSQEAIDEAVDQLVQGRYVEAVMISAAFGDNPAHWEPSILTSRGHSALMHLDRQQKGGA